MDSAGRVSSVSNPANQIRFAEVASYAEHGAIQTLKLGGLLTGVEAANEVWTYNNRLQPIETRLRTGGSALNLSRLEYFYCPAQLLSCTTNNGNLRSQRISNEAVGSEPSWTTLQQYGYDPLNRLTTFTDGAATETNNYDPWGNRWATVSGLTPSPLTPGDASWFNPGNNRISNLGYDQQNSVPGTF